MSIAEHDVIACPKRSKGFEVATWIDEHGFSLCEKATGVLGRGAKGAEITKPRAEWRVPHHLVKEQTREVHGVLQSMCEEHRLQHREAASAVVGHEECGALGKRERYRSGVAPGAIEEGPEDAQEACTRALSRLGRPS